MVFFPLSASLEISLLGLYLESTCSLTHPPRPKSPCPNQEVPEGQNVFKKSKDSALQDIFCPCGHLQLLTCIKQVEGLARHAKYL